MRTVAKPLFTDRTTRSTRRNIKESEATFESLPDAGTKRKGKGKAVDALKKKPRLADSYLDPFADTGNELVPEPSLTPAQSDALSLSLRDNNNQDDDPNIDPQLSRMGQAALSASVDSNFLPEGSSGHGLSSHSDSLSLHKTDLFDLDTRAPDSNSSSEAPLCSSPSPIGPIETGILKSEMIPALPPLQSPRREFLLPAIPKASSRAPSTAPDTLYAANRNSKTTKPNISFFTKSPCEANSRSLSITPMRPGHSRGEDTSKTRQTSTVSSTKKFTFLALPSKIPARPSATPAPRRIDLASLSVNKKLSTKPITPAFPSSSLSESSPLFRSDASHPIMDIKPFEEISTSSGSITAPRHHIPKVVSDKIASLENTVSNLLHDFDATALKMSGLIQDHQLLLKENSSLKTKLRAIEERTTTLENDTAEIEQSVSANTRSLSKLDNILEDLSTGPCDTRPLGSKNSVKKAFKPVRENIFNTAVRKCLLRVMQTDGKNVKFLKPLDDGNFLMHDPETDDGVILRPNFEISWLDNSSWHDSAVKFIRDKAPVYTPAFTEQLMNAKTNADILERIASIFKGWAGAYSKQKRKEEAGVAGDPTSRRKGRKIRKFHQREAVRDIVKMHGPEWDFFFQAAYQSTDETDEGNNMDPDSEVDDIDIKVKEKAWLSRAPYYRSELFQSAVDAIEVAVARHQASQMKDGKTAPHRRRRGSQKERDLPIPGKKKRKIPLVCIDPQWIEDHPDEHRPTRVDMEEGDGEMLAEEESDTDIFDVKDGMESDSDELYT